MQQTANPQLPNSTLPANLPLALMNFADNPEFVKRFSDHVSIALISCGRFLDLEKLAGVTVGYDFDAALASVDLGFESTVARQYTNNGEVICVAKAMNVLRNEVVMSHVVYNANFIEPLLDSESQHHMLALHILAHELGHVAELKWRDEAMPGVLLRQKYMSQVDGMLTEAAIVIWEEYAACRLTARLSDEQQLKVQYAEAFDTAARKSLELACEKIKRYRTHGQIDQLLVEAGEPLAMPLKLVGYLLGHLDGIEDTSSLRSLCPGYANTHLTLIVPRVLQELRTVWDTRDKWSGVNVFDPLRQLVIDTFEAGGIYLIPRGDEFYVNVPFSGQTMPNGESDMGIVRYQALLDRISSKD